MEISNADLSLNDLYYYFCLAAGAQNIQLFNGDERENFLADCKDACYRAERRGKKYRPRLTIEHSQYQMKEIILRLFCSGYNTLYDSAVSWLEPEQEVLEDALYKLEEYVKIDCLKARFDFNHEWHRCEKCKEITPYLLKGKCPTCGSSATHVLNADGPESL